MTEIRFALVRFEEKDTIQIITHVVPTSDIKKIETVAGKKECVLFKPKSITDFSRTQWYLAFKRIFSLGCKEDHVHGKFDKAKILHLGGKYLIFFLLFTLIRSINIYLIIVEL